MAIITKVQIQEFNGNTSIYVWYKNGNPLRNDRARLYPTMPKSAEKFIKTATVETCNSVWGKYTTYT